MQSAQAQEVLSRREAREERAARVAERDVGVKEAAERREGIMTPARIKQAEGLANYYAAQSKTTLLGTLQPTKDGNLFGVFARSDGTVEPKIIDAKGMIRDTASMKERMEAGTEMIKSATLLPDGDPFRATLYQVGLMYLGLGKEIPKK